MPTSVNFNLDEHRAYIDTLKNSLIFSGLDRPAVEAIYQTTRLEQYKKDDYIFYEGQPANTIFILVKGAVYLSQVTLEGQQVIIHYLSPGKEIGIMALFPDQVYPVTAVSTTNSILLGWSRENLSSLLLQFPQLALNALQMMTERFVVRQNQYRQLATERADQRIARTLLKIAEKSGTHDNGSIQLTPPPSRQQIAEMTGTTLYTVSRICSRWEKDGMVQTNRRRLQIKDKKALEAILIDGTELRK